MSWNHSSYLDYKRLLIDIDLLLHARYHGREGKQR
jgi:hypothetical protein